MENEPFGRQPHPVKVTIEGELVDVDYWVRLFRRYAESQGDDTTMYSTHAFKIYPRAVND